MVRYLGDIYKRYHTLIYEKNGTLPEIQLENLAIDYGEIYQKAMEDYIDAIVNKKPHAVTASFTFFVLISNFCKGKFIFQAFIIWIIVLI